MYLCEQCLKDNVINFDYYGDKECECCGAEAEFKCVDSDSEVGKLVDKMLNFIAKRYGLQEAEDPSYDLIALAEAILEEGDSNETC